MGSLFGRNVDKTAPMHVDSVPTVLTEHFKQYLGPFFESLFFGYDKLQIDREAKIELISDSTFLLLDNDWGYAVCNALKTVELMKLLFSEHEGSVLFW
jgi:hypothetical protein